MQIVLDHINYSSLELNEREIAEPHIHALFNFLREWYNDSSYIEAHTSGSTGKPKRILLPKADMMASARITNRFFGLNHKSTLLLDLPIHYIAGKMMVVRALACGGALLTQPPTSNPVFDLNESVDLAAWVPLQLQTALQQSENYSFFSLIRNLLIGGAPLDTATRLQVQDLSTRCYATYGMTETASHIALQPLNGENQSAVYETLPPITVGVDSRGCLSIETPHLSQKQFITNDRVELIDAMHFVWQGRIDHVINSGGIKISPEAIERKLEHLLLDTPFFITGLPDQRLGQRVVLVIESTPWNKQKEDNFLAQSATVLTRFEMPREVIYLEHFNRTTSGKIIRKI